MDAYAKKLTINIDINELAEKRVQEIKQVLDQHKGDGKLHFQVFDPKSDTPEQLYVRMPSKKQKVKISQELLTALEDHAIHYKLN